MTEIDTIYNRFGEPELRVLDNGRLVSFDGGSVGFVNNGNLYNYNGHHIGWYTDGIIRDHNGCVVGFGEQVTDPTKPLLPLKQLKPLPSLIELEPPRPLMNLSPLRPYKYFDWSPITPQKLFYLDRR